MRNLLRVLVLLPALIIAACNGDKDEDEVALPASLGREFDLRYGQTIDVGPMTLKFVAVTEESRCPINAACVAFWEGNARIQLAASTGRVSDILELNTNPSLDNFVIFEGHFVTLRHLAPEFPLAPRGPLDDYVATLLVDGQVLPAH